MFQSVTAVSNCAFVPVIPTMEAWSPVFVPDRLVAVIPVAETVARATPPTIAYTFVASPPIPVFAVPRCGIKEGLVEEEAQAPIAGVVLKAEFITSPVIPEPQVTEDGANAWKSHTPLDVEFQVHCD